MIQIPTLFFVPFLRQRGDDRGNRFLTAMKPKKLIIFFIMLACVFVGVAQDIIMKKDGTLLNGKVVEITEQEVKYRKADNPDEPVYTVKIADVSRINYDNGASDVFDRKLENTQVQQTATDTRMLTGQGSTASDLDLLMMNKQHPVKSVKWPKRMSRIGLIGGSAMVLTGVILLAISPNKIHIEPYTIPGIVLCGVGAIGGTTMFIIGHRQQKKLDRMNFESTSIFEHNVFDNGDKSLTLSANVLSNRMNNRAFGLGMTYTF